MSDQIQPALQRAFSLALVLLLACAPLAACGKKGQPTLPAGEKSTYPHPYPAAATQQNATPSVPGGHPDDDTTQQPATTTPLDAKHYP
jgi:predicted small lipoprotein YifL